MQFELRQKAHRGYLKSFRASLNGFQDPHQLYLETRPVLKQIINTSTILKIRILICVNVIFKKIIGESSDELEQKFYFCSHCERILSSFQTDGAITRCFSNIQKNISNFVRNGSGWVIKKINFIDLHLGKYRENKGGCKRGSLPQHIQRKKALLDIECEDNACFLYSVAAGLFPQKKNSSRASLYKKFLKYLKIKNLTFPMSVENIPRFETMNKITVHVFGYEENEREIYPMYISPQKFFKQVDIFLHKKHFYLIKNFNRLLGTKSNSRYFCKRCLNGFKRRSTLENHTDLCINHKVQKTRLPRDPIIKFKNLGKMLYHPFCIFCDFECLTQKYSNPLPSTSSSFTVCTENHRAISYSMICVDINDRPIFHENYCGKDVIKHFLHTLKNISRKLILKMKEIIPLNESGMYVNSNRCHICRKTFLQGEIRVRDHNHYGSGEFRGMAHQWCNLNYRATYFIPVVIHNSKNYDSHLILKELPMDYAKRIEIIPSTMEKFTMFSLDEIRFIDSYQFLEAPLDVLVQNLNASGHQFKIFERFFENSEHRHLLLRKGVFPYSYLCEESVLSEKKLPSKPMFYNNLINAGISDKDYNHAQLVYSAFKCKTFGDYLEIYNDMDAILLAEIFCSFRRSSFKHYSLDPVHFVTGAELTWNAGLKFSRAELELFQNVDQYLWIESQMRGGVCMLGTRYAKANNISIPENYNPLLPSSHILALDVNNLYGYVMSQPLPVGNFAWLTRSEIQEFNIFKCKKKSAVGFFLEVDLIYPSHLHDKHNCYPLAAEHMFIKQEMLSPYAKNICAKFNIESSFPCKKLVPNFYEKKNYICHYLNLQFYVKQGLIIKKIHRVLSFSQSPFIKDYIAFNNDMRSCSASDFEKAFFKKMNNAFFGKCCQSSRRKLSLRASLNESNCKKYLSSPLLENFQIVNEDFSIFKFKKPCLVLDKPIYVGFSILEMSKLHMYKLYYNHFKKIYNEKIELLYTDTDSLFLHIKTEDAYSDLQTHFSDIVDCSNFPPNHRMHDDRHKNKLGYLKSEAIEPISEFVGLKSKMYAFSFGNQCKKRAKGVKKSTLRDINFKTYANVLKSGSYLRHSMQLIISENHQLKTVTQNKISLSCFYDKKYLEIDGIHSKSYGHYEIEKSE